MSKKRQADIIKIEESSRAISELKDSLREKESAFDETMEELINLKKTQDQFKTQTAELT